MHPYLLASLIVGGVAVVYATFLVFKELHEHTEYVYVDEKESSSRRARDQLDDYDEEFEEKTGVLRRRKKSSNNNTQLSSVPTQSEDEQELLDRLSYLNAVEQEIERRKKALAEEERILREQEAQIEIRKQYIQSASSNSASDLTQKVLLDTGLGKGQKTAPKIQTEDFSSEILYSATPDFEKGNSVSDTAAHNILRQHLSHISNQQQQQQAPNVAPPSTSSVRDVSSETADVNQNLQLPTSGNQRLVGSVISEASWSEIGSVSEHQETMSTGSEIDVDDVDAIEH